MSNNARLQREYKKRMLDKGYYRASAPYIPDTPEARKALKLAIKNICEMYDKDACISAKS